MKSLLKIFPQATVVRLGGRDVVVRQMTVFELALLQHWLARRTKHPIEDKRDVLNFLDNDERKAVLREMRDEALDWPVELGSDEAAAHLCSGEGLLAVLNLVTDLDAESKAEVVRNMTTQEHAALARAYRGHGPDREFKDLYRPIRHEEGDPREQPSWAEYICHVAEVYGWTFDQIGSLTISQFWAAYNKGQEPSRSVAIPIEVVADPEARRAFLEKL